MLKLLFAGIVFSFIAAVVYFIIDYEMEARCPTCGKEMDHWDDRTIYCGKCKVIKKLW